jgi:DNA-binding CsgD family transcriptional regulator
MVPEMVWLTRPSVKAWDVIFGVFVAAGLVGGWLRGSLVMEVGMVVLGASYALLGRACLKVRHPSELDGWFMAGVLAGVALAVAGWVVAALLQIVAMPVLWLVARDRPRAVAANAALALAIVGADYYRFVDSRGLLSFDIFLVCAIIEICAFLASMMIGYWITGIELHMASLVLVAPSAAAPALDGPLEVSTTPADNPMSTRELEVLALVAQGMANPEIASQLYLSPATVKTHVSRILAKLDVPNRTAAVTLATARGWL